MISSGGGGSKECTSIFDAEGNLLNYFDAQGALTVDACWTPIKNFSGSIDGNKKTISNLKVPNNVGLFENLPCGANIHDVTFENVNVKGSSSVGGLVGNTGNTSGSCTDEIALTKIVMNNVTVKAETTVGGMIGVVNDGSNVRIEDVTINNINVAALKIGDPLYAGGLIGHVKGGVVKISNAVPVPVDPEEKGHYTPVLFGGNVTGEGHDIGGLIGSVEDDATADISTVSVAVNSVFGLSNVGGLIGSSGKNTSITRVASRSEYVKSKNTNVGGLVGFNKGLISSSESYARVTVMTSGIGAKNYGGLVGENAGVIRLSANVGDVYCGDAVCGGLVGSNESGSSIEKSFNAGVVYGSGSSQVGGVAGNNAGTISNSYNGGYNVYGKEIVGGFVGSNSNSGTIKGSFNFGEARAGNDASKAGGFFGTNESTDLSGNFFNIDFNANVAADPAYTSLAVAGITTIEFSEGRAPGFNADPWVAAEKVFTKDVDYGYKLKYTLPRLDSTFVTHPTYTVLNARDDSDKIFNIGTEEQLFLFATMVNLGVNDAYGVLINDINITEGRKWIPIGQPYTTIEDGEPVVHQNQFVGQFYGEDPNGNLRIIKGLNLTSDDTDNVGFFAQLGSTAGQQPAMVANLLFENVTFKGKNNVGVVAGIAEKAMVMGIEIRNASVAGADNVGGFIGSANGVSFMGSTNGHYIAKVDESCEDKDEVSCETKTVNDGSVKGSYNIGGIVGSAQDVSFSTAKIGASVTGLNNVGGLAGSWAAYNAGNVQSVVNYGAVAGAEKVGGLMGEVEVYSASSTVSVESVSNEAESVTGTNFVGGLVGKLTANARLDMSVLTNFAKVSASNEVGGLVGEFNGSSANSSMETAFNAGSVTSNGNNVGGLVGKASKVRIKTAYNKGDVFANTETANGSNNVGGLVGQAEGAYISQVYNRGEVKGFRYVGGLVGKSVEGSLESAVNVGAVSGSQQTSCVVGSGTIAENVYFDNEFCTSDNNAERSKSTEQLVSGIWNGVASFEVEDIDTTSAFSAAKVFRLPDLVPGDKPQYIVALQQNDNGIYEINDANQLRWFAEIVNSENGEDNDAKKAWNDAVKASKAKLMENITLNKSVPEYPGDQSNINNLNRYSIWTPIKDFAGEFDGNGNSISGLMMACSDKDLCDFKKDVALFARTEETANIKNLTMRNIFIGKLYYATTEDAVNAAALVAQNNGTIDNCHLVKVEGDKSHIEAWNNVGGLVAVNNGTISNSSNNVPVFASKGNVGGIVGLNDGTGIVRNSFNAGTISGESNGGNYGGLIGKQTGSAKMLYCLNMGDVSAMASSNTAVGGMIGDAQGEVKFSYNTASVSASTQNKNVGGVVGKYDGDATNIQNIYFNKVAYSGKAVGSGYTMDQESFAKSVADMVTDDFANLLNTDTTNVWTAPSVTYGESSAVTPYGVQFDVAFTLPFFAGIEQNVENEVKPVVDASFSIQAKDQEYFMYKDFRMDDIESVSLVFDEVPYNDFNDIAFTKVGMNDDVNTIKGSFRGVQFSFDVMATEVPAIQFADCDGDECESATIYGATKRFVYVDKDVSVKNIEFVRSFEAGKFATLMLPFTTVNFSPADVGIEVYRLSDMTLEKGKWRLILEALDKNEEMKAHTPYIVKPTITSGKLVFGEGFFLNTNNMKESVMNIDKGNLWETVGVYEYKEFKDLTEKAYGYASIEGNNPSIAGKFLRINTGETSNAYIQAMRFYVRYKGTGRVVLSSANNMAKPSASHPAALPEEIEVVIKNGEKTTSIGTLNARTGKFVTNRFFDVKGRSLGQNKPSVKGSYYNKGKKVAK